MNTIILYDTEFDWTRTLSDEELLIMLEQQIELSKKLQEEASVHGFEFIDTSFDREHIITEKIKNLITSGKLYRTDSSYNKYKRKRLNKEETVNNSSVSQYLNNNSENELQ